MLKEKLFDDAYVRLSKPAALSCGRGMDGFSNGAVAIVEEDVVFQCGGKRFSEGHDASI